MILSNMFATIIIRMHGKIKPSFTSFWQQEKMLQSVCLPLLSNSWVFRDDFGVSCERSADCLAGLALDRSRCCPVKCDGVPDDDAEAAVAGRCGDADRRTSVLLACRLSAAVPAWPWAAALPAWPWAAAPPVWPWAAAPLVWLWAAVPWAAALLVWPYVAGDADGLLALPLPGLCCCYNNNNTAQSGCLQIWQNEILGVFQTV